MTKLIANGHVWRVELDETDTLKDMAAVSGYTVDQPMDEQRRSRETFG